MIKAVIFDCFGVLTSDSWKEFVDGQPKNIDRNRLHELNHQLDAGLLNRQEFLDQVFELTGSKPLDVEDKLDNEVSKNTPLFNYIKELRERGYKIGMISNISSSWITDKFLTQEEQELFTTMVFSYQVGTTKPDPKIFEVALEKLDVTPKEVIFIDDIPAYCEAAQFLGMNSVVYKDFNSMKKVLEGLLN